MRKQADTPTGHGRLAELARDINQQHRKAKEAFRRGVLCAKRAGQLLIEAKGQVAHGEWQKWLGENFDGSVRTAQDYMKIARHWDDLKREMRNAESAFSIASALAMIKWLHAAPDVGESSMAQGNPELDRASVRRDLLATHLSRIWLGGAIPEAKLDGRFGGRATNHDNQLIVEAPQLKMWPVPSPRGIPCLKALISSVSAPCHEKEDVELAVECRALVVSAEGWKVQVALEDTIKTVLTEEGYSKVAGLLPMESVSCGLGVATQYLALQRLIAPERAAVQVHPDGKGAITMHGKAMNGEITFVYDGGQHWSIDVDAKLLARVLEQTDGGREWTMSSGNDLLLIQSSDYRYILSGGAKEEKVAM